MPSEAEFQASDASPTLPFAAPFDMSKVVEKLSRDRLRKYLAATNGDIEASLALYAWNHEVGSAFNVVLQQFEICLRNSVQPVLENCFKEAWHKNYKLKNASETIQKDLAAAEKKARENRKGFDPSTGDVVAATSMGFWREICKPMHAGLIWSRRVEMAFPNKPAVKDLRDSLEQVHVRVDHLVKLRNRIAHHEPIISSGGNMDGKSLRDRHNEMRDLLEWMDADFTSWVFINDRFPAVIEACPLPVT